MKIYFSHYQLAAERRGALLKIQFPDGTTGHADCHPWVSLGDESLEIQLEKLKRGQLTPILERSLYFAKLDAKARVAKRNLFSGLKIPPSNFLFLELADNPLKMLSQAIEEGFKTIKFKMAKHKDRELRWLRPILEMADKHKCRLRFDFNCKLTVAEFHPYASVMAEYSHVIDYCEDPVLGGWSELKELAPLRLAADRAPIDQAADILIFKPAVQSETLFQKDKRPIVVTSYLDHPLGQLTAAYTAAGLLQKGVDVLTCGLLSHRVYEPNPYSKQLAAYGPEFRVPEGTGFGFDQLLKKEQWKGLGDIRDTRDSRDTHPIVP